MYVCVRQLTSVVVFPITVKFDNYVPLIIVCAIYGFFAFSLLPIALELSVECKLDFET